MNAVLLLVTNFIFCRKLKSKLLNCKTIYTLKERNAKNENSQRAEQKNANTNKNIVEDWILKEQLKNEKDDYMTPNTDLIKNQFDQVKTEKLSYTKERITKKIDIIKTDKKSD